jgi:hypothetical protein
MLAPVYRNVEARSTVLGLAFPTETLTVLSAFWGAILTLPPSIAALVTVAVYALVRLASLGRAPAFFQHWLAWRVRQALTEGRLSAVARSRIPRFPFGPYEIRDRSGRGVR